MTIRSDLEIAHSCTLRPMDEIAGAAGLLQQEWEPYGRDKAKVELSVLRRLETSGALRVYSIEHNGRLRKYYAITDEGRQKIQAFLQEWEAVMKVYEFIRRDEA